MLGNIARKLRLMGYDTAYSSDIDDNDLIKKAKIENRIIISKDIQLINLAKKQKTNSIKINHNTETEQILEIFRILKIKECFISAENSRCPLCNGVLNEVSSSSIVNEIPKKIQEKNQKFWKCSICAKNYWEGTHIINMQNFTNSINEQL